MYPFSNGIYQFFPSPPFVKKKKKENTGVHNFDFFFFLFSSKIFVIGDLSEQSVLNIP